MATTAGSPVANKSQTELEMDKLNSLADNLSMLLTQLEQRLASVLVQEPKSPDMTEKACNPVLVPLADALYRQNSRLDEFGFKLNKILTRLEV
jgi:hypothetical protein